MAGLFERATIGIPCPQCGTKTPKTVAWMKANKEYTCSCGRVIHLEADEFLSLLSLEKILPPGRPKKRTVKPKKRP